MFRQKKHMTVAIGIMAAIVVIFVVLPSLHTYRKEHALRNKLTEGQSLFNEGDYSKAIILFSEVYDRSKGFNEHIDALYMLGRSYFENNDNEKANDLFNRLLEDDGKKKYRDEALFYLGKIAKTQGEFKKASRLYEELLTKSRDSKLADITLYEEALLQEKKGELKKAREMLSKIVEDFPDSENIVQIQEDLGRINMSLLFSPIPVEGESFLYTIESGDSLDKIAKMYGTTIELLREANGLKNDLIHVGDRLKVIHGTFSLVVDKSQNILILKLNDKFFRLYHVGTGKNNNTPIGDYKIINKIKDPPWYTDGKVIPFGDPENLLGTRWMGIDKKGFGIHGTWEPESIGSQSSAGCIRLRNEDVEELFKIVPHGTAVIIVD